ncbi:MAG: ATP-binding cassette domain-containing protein [Phycisphaera sp.]|nr:ATP-binding cassette domain-containing protein [Phycisphaera sp.]
MALLSIANLELSLGDRKLLTGVNLTLEAGEHVGMVGRNGCGKSTLLKLIAGIGAFKPDAGQVQVARNATVGYLHQDPNLDLDRTLREEAGSAFAHLDELHKMLEQLAHDMATAEGNELDKLLKQYEQTEQAMHSAGGYDVDHRIDATLHGLGLEDYVFDVKVGALSGGQRGRLALAKLLLSEPDILLLDEPTNHLDIAARQWLEEFLSTFRGAVLLVSHDRWLLDRAVAKICEMESGRLVEYPGNYAKFRELRAERRIAQQRDFEKQQTYIKQQQQFIDRYRAGQRARQAQGREKRLERFKRDESLDRPMESQEINIRIAPAQRPGDLIVTADQLTKGYDGKPLFRGFSIVVKRGDRVGVIGPNGAGKSTLINCLLGHVPPDSGTTRVGPSVDVGYFRQSHDHLDLSRTIVEHLRYAVPGGTNVGGEQAARDLAGAFLFSGDEQDKPLTVLSGGERSRCVLAGLVASGHNLLVLDEPTNHLDIASAERLEQAITLFTATPEGYGQQSSGGGTVILITHDRMLLENLVDQLIILDGHGHAKHFVGSYSDYLESQRQATPAPTAAPAPPKPKAVVTEKPTKNSSRGGGGGGVSLEKLEARIVKLESQLANIDKQLADPEIYRDGKKVKDLQTQRQKLRNELTPIEEEWSRRAEGA